MYQSTRLSSCAYKKDKEERQLVRYIDSDNWTLYVKTTGLSMHAYNKDK